MSTLNDPRFSGPQPPFDENKLDFPGLEQDLKLKPDHGENSYVGAARLSGRKALITGGDSGIGAAVAIAYAREGADVAIAHLPEEQADADGIIAQIEKTGQKAVSLATDIREADACQKLIERAVTELGGLDILVNNAAYQYGYESLDEITEDEFDRTFKTNIYATFFLSKAALPHLKPGSCIINTTSVQSYKPSPILVPYAASKAAITNVTKGLSHLLIEQGIRVNAVAPGPIWSPLNPMAMPRENVKEFGSQTPMGRPGQPAELASAYVFLASDEASYVTGAVYEITGGQFTA